MLTQIYEIGTPEEARAISAIGVDHIGILVGDGRFPREQPVAAARWIATAISRPAKFSALFLAADLGLIEQAVRELGPDIIHLGAAPDRLSAHQAAAIKETFPNRLLMRSVPVVGEESLAIAREYDGIADLLLLDSHRAGDSQIGALGVTHDWTISRHIVETVGVPVILAGGLGPDNVAEAIRAVRPAGVDSKTRTDRNGTHAKDFSRVRRFYLAARAADKFTASAPAKRVSPHLRES